MCHSIHILARMIEITLCILLPGLLHLRGLRLSCGDALLLTADAFALSSPDADVVRADFTSSAESTTHLALDQSPPHRHCPARFILVQYPSTIPSRTARGSQVASKTLEVAYGLQAGDSLPPRKQYLASR